MKINYLRYFGIYILVTIGFSILSYGLDTFFNISAGTGVATAVIPIVSAMIEGQLVGRKLDHEPTGGEKWKAAFWMAMISLAFTTVIITVLITVVPGDLLQSIPLWIWVAAIVFLHIIVFLMSRLGLGMGLKQGMKLAQ